jgi:hypothetical protein
LLPLARAIASPRKDSRTETRFFMNGRGKGNKNPIDQKHIEQNRKAID